MSTPSIASAPSLSTVSRRAAAWIAAAAAAIAVVVVVALALNTGTTQPTLASPISATPVKSITPAGANMQQGLPMLSYATPFAGHR
jgi:hypothetical protein